jgi:hypothetical protein
MYASCAEPHIILLRTDRHWLAVTGAVTGRRRQNQLIEAIMSAHFAHQDLPQLLPETDRACGIGQAASVLTPLLAGARARGMADAFELLGKAALMIDASGGVLHVSEAAARLFGDTLTLTSRHLIAASDQDNSEIEAMIGRVLAGAPAAPIVVGLGSPAPLKLSVLPIAHASDPCQLLRAIVFIEIAG